MAATEVRTVWHRTVNHYFIQEDTKRAPKFACRQSSCATPKLDDLGLATASDKSVHNAGAIMQKTCMVDSKNLKACSETLTKQETTMEVDSDGCLVSKQTKYFSMDSDYSWIKDDTAQPWWKTIDRDELACLVSKKLLNAVENCDLPPPPQKKYLGEQSYADISDYNTKTCFDCEAKSSVFSNLTVEPKDGLDSGMMHKKIEPPFNKGHLYFSSDKSSSYSTIIQECDTEQAFEGDQSIAQLMEALCHSQTRAKEAEELAKQAYAEKERIISLFFTQASHLFAYKQWCRLLHLDTQVKNKHNLVSTRFRETLPSMSFEGKKPLKRKRKFVNDKEEKLCKGKSDVSTTYDVAFGLGLSLVGAGLLLGWAVGWMLPSL